MKNLRKLIIFTACAVSFFAISCSSSNDRANRQTNVEDSLEQKRVKAEYSNRMNVLMKEKRYENALSLIDSLHVMYPDEPMFYFCEGYIYDIQGFPGKSRSCFEKALSLYDSIIKTDNDLKYLINRAFIVQILYGKDAYNKTLDSIAGSLTNKNDSMPIEMFREIDYDKDKMDIFN